MSKNPALITFLILLLLLVYFEIPIISAKENVTSTKDMPPTLWGTLTQTDCRTYYPTTLLDFLCPVPTPAGSLGFCDSHCRCIHRAKWGYCEKRPQWAPSGTGLSGQWCRCSYDDPPKEWAAHSGDIISCPVWRLTDFMCTSLQVNNATAGCNADCICSHGFKNGYCNKDNYCICSNQEIVNTPNVFNPLGLFNQILGG